MTEPPPIYEGEPPSDEAKRLAAMFDELEKKQLEFLDEAAKRIVELCTGLLGVLFAVTAFGDKFPPPYLGASPIVQVLAVLVLALYFVALLAAVVALQPREYRRYQHNVTEMRRELDKIIRHKSGLLKVSGTLFVGASLALAVLIAALIFAA